jgi:hypothetical protein
MRTAENFRPEEAMEMNPSPETREREKEVSSVIELQIFRHGDKEKDPQKTDEQILLTAPGRLQAKRIGKERATGKPAGEGLSQSVAKGSNRLRAQETAALVMGGAEETITGEETFAELKQKLDQGLKKGSKIGTDRRLNFDIDEKTAFGAKALEEFKAGRYLKFIVEQSDALAAAEHDQQAEPYSKTASKIAELICNYIRTAPRWDKLVNEPGKHYEDTLRRFMGTHQGIAESFMAKLIEETKGIDGSEGRDAFVAALDNKGFGFVEGFNVRIETDNAGKRTVRISYEKPADAKQPGFKFDEIVPEEVLQKMILSENK